MQLRSAAEWIKALAAVSCCLRSCAKIAATASQSPASARAAASINLLVTPLIAETTTTRLLPRDAARMMSTTFRMQDASPTDVPPNFIIRSGSPTFPQVWLWIWQPWRTCPELHSEAAAVPSGDGILVLKPSGEQATRLPPES